MNILLVLIPVTLLVIGIAVAVFFWAVNHQQFDDLDSPGVLPLLDTIDDHASVSHACASHASTSEALGCEAADQGDANSPLSSDATPPATTDAGHDQPA